MTEQPRFSALKGTYDVLPPESWTWQRVTRLALDSFAIAGYAPIETPVFERTELFERGVGQGSDIVSKQMYTFSDRAGRSLTLRPEGTAPVVRAVLEHGLNRRALPVKLAYAGPMFRQERPQKGRHRQLFQIGIEALGADNPAVDAEVIEVGMRFLTDVGVDARLLLNSVGHADPSCRQGYVKVLSEFLEARRDQLAPEDRVRVDTNALRTFDSKEERTRAALVDAPLISDHLCAECRNHFEELQGLLGGIGVAFTLEPRLVRGLDYYARTAFEYVAEGLGAQNAVGAGGRYDGLSETLGGPALPGVGFALGLDRILLAAAGRDEVAAERGAVDVYVISLGAQASRLALRVVTSLRRRGVGADLDLVGRSMKGQMKEAARSGAGWAVILGEAEIGTGSATLKDLASGAQTSVALQVLEREWRP